MQVLRWPALLALAMAVPARAQVPAVKTTTDEVLLDLVVRDKKGKPVTDLKPEDLVIRDNDTKQTITSFRLVKGPEAVNANGAVEHLDALRQVRLVTLAFEATSDIAQRKLAREAALDLIKGDSGSNAYFSVVVIDMRLMVLEPYTTDKTALTKAINRATEGVSAPRLASESEAIRAELQRRLGAQTGASADTKTNLTTTTVQTAGQGVASGDSAVQARLATVLLDVLRADAGAAGLGTRLTLSSMKAMVEGMRAMPGRKSVVYFSAGMYVTPELDQIFRNLVGSANRENITFYAVDTRGVMTASQNADATDQLRGAANASQTTILRTDGGATKEEIMASDKAELSGRANIDLPLRDLAQSTGGFLIGESNDLRVPLRHVNEEIAGYYEVSYNPAIKAYDNSFRKIAVSSNRKDLVIHSRSGYFALPPEARAAGMAPYEVPLLTVLSAGKLSEDVAYRAGTVELQPKGNATQVSILVELPLHSLQAKHAAGALDIHCLIGALVKDANGEVVQKITHDRALHVKPDQQQFGVFLEKAEVFLAPGKYTLETAVIDQESSKSGMQKSEFTVSAASPGVHISGMIGMRSYTQDAKNLDPAEPYQFQGGAITPTLESLVKKRPDALLRLFFTVYPDAGNQAKPSVEVEFQQQGKVLTKVPMQLPFQHSGIRSLEFT